SIASVRPGGSFFVSLVGEGLALCASSGRYDLKARLLASIFNPDLNAANGAPKIGALRPLFAALPEIVRGISAERALPIVALAVADLLAEMPGAIRRRIALKSVESLLTSSTSLQAESASMGVAAVLLACPWDS